MLVHLSWEKVTVFSKMTKWYCYFEHYSFLPIMTNSCSSYGNIFWKLVCSICKRTLWTAIYLPSINAGFVLMVTTQTKMPGVSLCCQQTHINMLNAGTRYLVLYLHWKLEIKDILLEIFATICSQYVKQFCVVFRMK